MIKDFSLQVRENEDRILAINEQNEVVLDKEFTHDNVLEIKEELQRNMLNTRDNLTRKVTKSRNFVVAETGALTVLGISSSMFINPTAAAVTTCAIVGLNLIRSQMVMTKEIEQETKDLLSIKELNHTLDVYEEFLPDIKVRVRKKTNSTK